LRPTNDPGLPRLLTFVVSLIAISRAVHGEDLSFRNDVMAVLSKSGCNLGTCHGNARGKGGFPLSLRGQDPAADFVALTRELFGRRVNSSYPDQSLLLLKPTMQLAHEGGKRFEKRSPEYQILSAWIDAGMPDDVETGRRLVRLHATPDEEFLTRRGGSVGDVKRAAGNFRLPRELISLTALRVT
jgi:hypothetical protein